MAFGGGQGFNFGQSSNNNATTPAFGGFGNNNSGGAFGQTSSGNAFGNSTAQSNPFGQSTSAFGGGNSGGFGANNNTNSTSLFGNKSTTSGGGLFGTSTNTGSGLFGNSTNNNTSGGFGNTSGGFGSTNNTSSPFGGNNTGSSFGGFGNNNKPTFGANTSSAPLFGQGGAGTTGGFGGAFGSSGSGTALNGNVGPATGTHETPFNAVTEKEANGTMQNFQSITMMPAYQKYSFEELRNADYNAGRRWGNGQTQGAGGFGSSTFGGFGQSNTTNAFASGGNSLFGNNNASSSSTPFGNTTSTAFGSGGTSGTGGGLFGNKPPATGGLFGQQSSGTTSGGLFGTANNTAPNTNPFGSSTNNTTGGGLFGNAAQKPLFGAANTTPNTGTAFSFGNNSTTTPSTGGLFGNSTTQQPAQNNLFGNANQNQPKPSIFGNTTGGFGNNTQTQSTGGIFGSSTSNNTGGGLFGNANNSNTGSGLFGNNTQQQNNTGGGLFGNTNNANKPGGLFGNSSFGNNNQQSGGGLFGNNNTTQQSGGLFSNTNNNSGGGFGFGNSQNQQKSSLFGTTNNNQGGGMFSNNAGSSSMFGNSQNQQQTQQQQDQFKHSSLLDPNPYGQSSIWTGLPQPNMENSKPLVTPLIATQKLKESQAKPPPSLRLNQSRYMTPPRRNGFGFSYSTYGTPNSAASTPGGNGLTNSMYGSRFTGGSFGRSMGKAASVNSLRTQYLDGESVLSPGAFAPSASRYSSGSIRRLTIDKSIRNDLFNRPPVQPLLGDRASPNGSSSHNNAPPREEPASENIGKLKKRVSFEKDVTGGLNGETGALVRTDDNDDTVIDEARPTNGAHKNNELAVVPEDRESEQVYSKKSTDSAKPDPKPGDYWMKPTRAELQKLPREKLKAFRNFQVGRIGCGDVTFNDPVDLTEINLDELFDKTIEIRLRAVTVYPDTVKKAPRGTGLNVPSTISIENSWPRNRGQVSAATSGPAFDKHVKRLQRIPGTTFVDYEPETGIWTFKVPHYTRYGLDYDDEDDEDFEESELSAPPDSIQKTVDASEMEMDSDEYDSSGQDDTFAIQSQRQKSIPGGFGRHSMIDDDMEDSILPAPEQDERRERSMVSEEEASDDDMDMAGSYPAPSGPVLNFDSPKPILKAPGTPGRPLLDLDGDWAEQLQRTISPRKQNRDALREAQSKILLDQTYSPIKPAPRRNDFRSSIDVMQAIFGEGKAQPEFEYPNAKRSKVDEQTMTDEDIAWHASFKPNFTHQNQLVYKAAIMPRAPEWETQVLARTETKAIVMSSLKEGQTLNIALLMDNATISIDSGAPRIEYAQLPFSTLRDRLPSAARNGSEGTVYELLHILFDDYSDEYTSGFDKAQLTEWDHRIRKDRLTKFLTSALATHTYPLTNVNDAAGAAFQHLTAHNVPAACEVLMKAKNFNLAMLIAQIEHSDDVFQKDMADQIAAWKDQGVISEMTEEVRSLYELLSGNTTICQGKPNGAVEDRATTFMISEKYELTWLQAFALRLWYGSRKTMDIEDAVIDFQDKIRSGEESATPVGADGKEDPLWVVLKLFACAGAINDIARPVWPEDAGKMSSKFDIGKTFGLMQGVGRVNPLGLEVDEEKSDDLSGDYAWQLEARGDVVGAVWAMTHIKNYTVRARLMIDLLCRHAATIDAPLEVASGSQQWHTLTQILKIPTAWIYSAKALYCRAVDARSEELQYLLLAQQWREGHDCLCKRVAPRLVIDEDYDTLQEVIAGFGKDVGINVQGWSQGGMVYADFASLHGKSLSPPAKQAALKRLHGSLSDMGAKLFSKEVDIASGGLEALEEKVAVKEMSSVVAGLLEAEGWMVKEVLKLPLTQEVKRVLGLKMAGEYYGKVICGGK